jgi:hypothetical protein
MPPERITENLVVKPYKEKDTTTVKNKLLFQAASEGSQKAAEIFNSDFRH